MLRSPRIIEKIPLHIRKFAGIYLLAIATFLLFRAVLFAGGLDRVQPVSRHWYDILRAFAMGVRFDVVISGYILFPPFFLLSALWAANRPLRLAERILFWYIFVLFSLSLLVCAADIPYFRQFFARFTVDALQWMDSPFFVLRMIFQEVRYWIFFVLFLALMAVFFYFLRRIFRMRDSDSPPRPRYWYRVSVSLLCLALMFLGIRGRIAEKSPIRVGTAYFGNNAFLNQLGLNPVFTLGRSWLDRMDERNRRISLMDDREALEMVRRQLSSATPGTVFLSDDGIARAVQPDTVNPVKHNVVIVIMESMATAKMGRYGNTKDLTPFLDSLATQGYSFDQVYTSGKHTYNGIFSTLFSFPCIFMQHPMKESEMINYNGIPWTLKQLGYSTTYFTTHDGQFDNVEGFLRLNGVDHVYTIKDYPSEQVHTTLGVPDDYMFRFAIPVISRQAQDGKPFFVTFMTASDHGPYYIPDYFSPRPGPVTDQVVEYADWSIRQFIVEAAKQPWFGNTLFVFIADHGGALSGAYDLLTDYFHSPLIFYGPEILKGNHAFDCLGEQNDVFPTVMGILGQPYVNNSLGIDLLRGARPWVLVNDDDKFGVLDRENLLIARKDGSVKLHRYPEKDLTDYAAQEPDLAARMRDHGAAQLQAFQYLRDRKRQFVNVKI